MKKLFLTFLIFPVIFSFGQDVETITLENCYTLSKENFSFENLNQQNLNSYNLRIKNIQTIYLPTLTMVGKATYQSNTIEIDLPIPNVEMPSVPLDQYNIYLEANQILYDGGYTKSQKKIEEIDTKINNNSLDIEFQQLKQQINQTYFLIILLDQQIKVVNVLISNLKTQLKKVESCIKNNILLPFNSDVMKVQILKAEQQLSVLESGKKSSINILSELTGKEIDENTNFIYPSVNISLSDTIINRPEIEMLNIQQEKMSLLSNQTNIQRRPTIGAFAQAGYGRPGLNMLSDDFSPYFIAGVQARWTIFDWNKTKRQKQILTIQSQIIDTQIDNTQTKISIELQTASSKISSLEKQIIKDNQIIDLQTEIVTSYSSQLQNGVITSSEYTAELNAVTQAKLNLEIHKIELLQAKINYLTIKGQL